MSWTSAPVPAKPRVRQPLGDLGVLGDGGGRLDVHAPQREKSVDATEFVDVTIDGTPVASG
jgi:hypothetical protein